MAGITSVRYLKSGRSANTCVKAASSITSLRAVLTRIAPLGIAPISSALIEPFVSAVAGMCKETIWQVSNSAFVEATAFTPSASIAAAGQNAS